MVLLHSFNIVVSMSNPSPKKNQPPRKRRFVLEMAFINLGTRESVSGRGSDQIITFLKIIWQASLTDIGRIATFVRFRPNEMSFSRPVNRHFGRIATFVKFLPNFFAVFRRFFGRLGV